MEIAQRWKPAHERERIKGGMGQTWSRPRRELDVLWSPGAESAEVEREDGEAKPSVVRVIDADGPEDAKSKWYV